MAMKYQFEFEKNTNPSHEHYFNTGIRILIPSLLTDPETSPTQ